MLLPCSQAAPEAMGTFRTRPAIKAVSGEPALGGEEKRARSWSGPGEGVRGGSWWRGQGWGQDPIQLGKRGVPRTARASSSPVLWSMPRAEHNHGRVRGSRCRSEEPSVPAAPCLCNVPLPTGLILKTFMSIGNFAVSCFMVIYADKIFLLNLTGTFFLI